MAVALLLLLLAPLAVSAEEAHGPAALRARHASLAPQLADNPFGGPVVLQSQEAARRIDGDVYAVIEHPFAAVSAALRIISVSVSMMETSRPRAMSPV